HCFNLLFRRLDFRNCNINHTEFESLPEKRVPDVLLVKRIIDRRGIGSTNPENSSTADPCWRLRRLRHISTSENPSDRVLQVGAAGTEGSAGAKSDLVMFEEKAETLADFMQDLQEDEELARQIEVEPSDGSGSLLKRYITVVKI
ncbi:unnamed protein product, partial [Protopolystoma xenopodis]